MTLYQFNSLNEIEQAEALWDEVFIGDRGSKLFGNFVRTSGLDGEDTDHGPIQLILT